MTERRALALAALAGAVALASTAPAGAAPPRLGPIVRIRTPGPSNCPAESEPDVVVTRAGTWVGYNDMHDCGYPVVSDLERITGVQLLPAGGGPARHVRVEPDAESDFVAGDPALTPDPQGDGVILASLYIRGSALVIETYRISPSLKVTKLPSPSPPEATSYDKEFIASDTSPRSRYRGRTYLVWDDLRGPALMFRAFDGRRWRQPVELGENGRGDVAVAPDGTVAVASEVGNGVVVRISKDGGATFGEPELVIAGSLPGRADPACAVFNVVGVRQRATRAVRAAYDAAGTLHVTAAVGNASGLPSAGVATGGVSRVVHASSRDGVNWRSAPIGETSAIRFHPVVSPTPLGGVGVAWLEVTGPTAYDAFVAFAPAGSAKFGAPVRLSPKASEFPSAQEALLNSFCYGIGDYIGLAQTARGVVAVWPTTDGTTSPLDTDVLAREVLLR